MKEKNRLTLKLGTIIMSILIICIIVISLSMYYSSYKEIKKAAGIELYGCANITTALVDPKDIEKILAGDSSVSREVGETISWTIDHKHIFEGQYIIDHAGTVLAVDQNVEKQGIQVGDQFYVDEEAISKLLETKAPTYSDVYTFNGMKRLTGYAPIFKDHNPDNEIIAISAIDFEAGILHDRTLEMVKSSLLFSVIPIILLGLITIFLIKKSTDPLNKIIVHARKVANGDLSVKDLKLDSKDEIGQLSLDINQLVHNLREIIGQVSISSEQVASASEQLVSGTEEIASSAEQNSVDVQNVQISSRKQLDIIQQSNATLGHISGKTDQIRDRAQALNEESNLTLKEAEKGQTEINRAISQMSIINSKADNLTKSMNVLMTKSDQIDHILTVITTISNQTNLLALNAAIEASRAGEFGNGFAVVASEIRKLAEESATATNQIGQLIGEIQEGTKEVSLVTTESVEAVQTGTSMIESAGKAFNGIQRSISKVAEEIDSVYHEFTDINHNLQEIVGAIINLEAAANENNENTIDITSHTEEQTASLEEITSLMSSMKSMAENLKDKVHKFKL